MLHRCPQRHLLCRGSSSVRLNEFECNVCGRRVLKESVSHSCNQCGVDVCMLCVEVFPADYSFRLRLAGLDIMGTPLLPVYEQMPSAATELGGDLPMAAVYWAYQAWANTDAYRGMLREEAARLLKVADVTNRAAKDAQMRFLCAQAEYEVENTDVARRCAL
jgi:hypothetical protein